MITLTKDPFANVPPNFMGLSTDEKPTNGVQNGSGFTEMDTGDKYVFNAESSEWLKSKSGDSGGGENPGGGGGGTGGGGSSVPEKDVNFYDYDGTRLYSYTIAQANALTELPPGPEHEGLVFQEWNWTLEEIKAQGGPVDVGATLTTDDGKTRICIELEEYRTSPVMCLGVNGTVTIDWGDGTEPTTVTGKSLTAPVYTSAHEYASPGEYVITLDPEGTFAILGSSNPGSYLLSGGNGLYSTCYQNAIRYVHIGENMAQVANYAFSACYSMEKITIPNTIEHLGRDVFAYCNRLSCAIIPRAQTYLADNVFIGCTSLSIVSLPGFLESVASYTFTTNYELNRVTWPNGITRIANYTFQECRSLAKAIIPRGVTEIPPGFCNNCFSLVKVVALGSVTSIKTSAFSTCRSVSYYDFTACEAVPSLAATNAFSNIPADCEIRVPAALVDEWKAATNWATYADKIVGV